MRCCSFRKLRLCGICLLLCVRVNLGGCSDASESEFACEEAAQHISSCCGRLGVSKCELISESSSSQGCSGDSIYRRHVDPELLTETAQCVRGATCEAIADAGICAVSSFLNPEVCTTTSICHGDGLGRICDISTNCATPSQQGDCTTYRPAAACTALQNLFCP